MKRFIIKRLILLVPMLLVVTMATFALSTMSAGDPAAIIARAETGTNSQKAVELVREELNLNRSYPQQYVHWLEKVVRLDMGTSYQTKKPVSEELMQRFPATLLLTVCATGIMFTLSLILGILSALHPNSLVDRIAKILSFITVSVPPFLFGLLLLYLFGVQWKLVSVVGSAGAGAVWLPAITLGVSHCGPFIMLIKSNMLRVLGMGYIKAARARGIKERSVVLHHALRNAILPALTKLGVTFGSMLGGSAVVESIFSWPGLGQMALDAIYNKDIPVLQGFMLVVATMIVLINLLVDIVYKSLDTKISIA
ncbi:ABC transporter permease [Aminipila butyrica]|uniref:ABC transporter permease n=1 Tax=Aminipila butyrica TaxID=433296 RepID=A0A858BRW9_9FIRM|nr:ABC transporter permease [Aminipila butyrica]QIB68072.1 ABC transporter permease [Aminipila butyrica]